MRSPLSLSTLSHSFPSIFHTAVATEDVVMDRASSPESGSESSDSNSDFSSEDGSSDVSDLGKFVKRYKIQNPNAFTNN